MSLVISSIISGVMEEKTNLLVMLLGHRAAVALEIDDIQVLDNRSRFKDDFILELVYLAFTVNWWLIPHIR